MCVGKQTCARIVQLGGKTAPRLITTIREIANVVAEGLKLWSVDSPGSVAQLISHIITLISCDSVV